ncbi:MAG: tetratricopeptide repeat protein [Flavobacteriales bacterium]|nr:tetratricopeptide repeat protein [Flavobacteriales bacterium]
MIKKVIAIFFVFCWLFTPAHLLYAQKNKDKKKKNEQSQTSIYDADRVKLTNLFCDAVTQKIIGNLDQALIKFQECLKLDATHGATNYEIASIYFITQKYEASLPYFNAAIKADPANKWYLLGYAQALIELKKYKDCEKLYKELMKLEPENHEYVLDLADIYIAQKKYKEAIGWFDQLEKRIGIHPEISMQKQKLYEGMGKPQAALEEIQKLIRVFPNNAQYYGVLAEVYLSMNKKDEALKAYEKVIELEPDNPIIHLALANFYQEKGDINKSFEYLKLAFQNPEVSIDDKVKIMLSYYEISQHNNLRKTQAYELLDLMIGAHPNDPKAWSMKGDYLVRDRRFEEAISCFETVNKFDNSRYAIWDQLLRLYAETRNWAMLAKRSEEAIELFPLQPLLYLYNGTAWMQQKNYSKALEVFSTGKELVLDARDLKSEFYAGMGDAYYRLKNYTEMEKAYENAVNTDPLNISAKNNYAYHLAKANRNLTRAQELINDVLKQQPQNVFYLDTQGYIYFRLKQYDKARQVFEELLKLGGDRFGEILEHYGDVLFFIGEKQKALEYWEKANAAGGELSEQINLKITTQQWHE